MEPATAVWKKKKKTFGRSNFFKETIIAKNLVGYLSDITDSVSTSQLYPRYQRNINKRHQKIYITVLSKSC